MFSFIDIYSFISVNGCVGMVPGALLCSASKMCGRDPWRVEPKNASPNNLLCPIKTSREINCMVVTCLDVCIIYFISCDYMMNYSSSYTTTY
jgi:hypothetical protein